MDNRILDFLTKHRICSLTTILPSGTPHAAALHFSHSENPFMLYFSTQNSSRKCQGLLNGETVQGAVVVGLSEEEWITVQMEGNVKAISDKTELGKIHQIHYSKHPHSEKYKNDPETLFLAFVPTWWRYTDYNTKPITLLSSE